MLPIIIGVVVMGIIVIVIAGIVIGIYNKLVTFKNRYKNAFSQIEVQLKRRYDLIPNLVETAKGYMKHESETLEAVIAARNQAARPPPLMAPAWSCPTRILRTTSLSSPATPPG